MMPTDELRSVFKGPPASSCFSSKTKMEISTRTLMIAIAATVMERCRLLDRIAMVDAEVDADEHLSEQVMDIDRALGELAGPYSEGVMHDGLNPNYETLLASTTESWRLLEGERHAAPSKGNDHA